MAAQGWCPSTHRIYRAPDGGLVRVKVPGGRLTMTQLRAVGTVARRFGTGAVDLTTRANLQIRGVDPDAAPGLRTVLAPIGLSAPTAAMEDRRNVLASPAAGLDPDEVLDVRPLTTAVVAALDALPEDLPLPHKFGVVLDGGGTPSLRGVATDVALGAVRTVDGAIRLEVALGAALIDGGLGVTIEPDAAPALVAAAAQLCAASPTRLADLVSERGGPAVLDLLLASSPPDFGPLTTCGAVSGPRLAGVEGERAALGVHPSVTGGSWVGVRAAAEPVTAERIAALADAVVAAGATEVRLTPWRSIVVAEPTDAHDAVRLLAAAGWTTEAATEPVSLRRTVGAVA